MGSNFQIKESPEGDWNTSPLGSRGRVQIFQIKESPEGDWNVAKTSVCFHLSPFQIKESPEGDWNNRMMGEKEYIKYSFKLKNPRKGTETSLDEGAKPLLSWFFQIKESPEGDWNNFKGENGGWEWTLLSN